MSLSGRQIVVVTGASGFLGFHVRALLHSMGVETRTLQLGDGLDVESAGSVLEGATTLLHLAGVNRGPAEEVSFENRRFASQIRDLVLRYGPGIKQLAFANSVQSKDCSVYGDAKREAATILGNLCTEIDASFRNVILPNLFGEYGKPHYNSVVATFSHLIATSREAVVQGDRLLDLLHVQTAARRLIGELTEAEMRRAQVQRDVSGLLSDIKAIASLYNQGELPSLTSEYGLDLFNTYRSYIPLDRKAIPLMRHADERGSFFEVAKAHGGFGQTSFSTTMPGVTRGEHYHLRKVERFVVVSGKAEIRMRPLFDKEVYKFSVSGDNPVALDMPTLWPHSITNCGNEPLYTMFWTNDLYNPESPDTFPEEV